MPPDLTRRVAQAAIVACAILLPATAVAAPNQAVLSLAGQ